MPPQQHLPQEMSSFGNGQQEATDVPDEIANAEGFCVRRLAAGVAGTWSAHLLTPNLKLTRVQARASLIISEVMDCSDRNGKTTNAIFAKSEDSGLYDLLVAS